MSFPLDKKYITNTETELGIAFPERFIQKMLKENGGEAFTAGDDWILYPFFDKTDNKRISRTCNHIGLETKKSKEWATFPGSAVAIGTNGAGDQLILLPDPINGNILSEDIYVWRHETGKTIKLADSIMKLGGIDAEE